MTAYPPDLEDAIVKVWDATLTLERANRTPDTQPLEVLRPAGRLIGALYTALDAALAAGGYPPRDSDQETRTIQSRLGYTRT